MTEEPDTSNIPEKLSIDNQNDFRFHAAYLAYSEAFDKAATTEARKELNENIMALHQNQIDYSTFYRNMDKYRQKISPEQRLGRTVIMTQRKRDWHKKMQKSDRNKRHRK